MNDRPSRRDHSDRGPREPQNPRGDRDQRRNDRAPRRDGEFKPRNDDRGHAPRRDEGDRAPRREDRGYAPRRDDRDRGPRRDGEFKPRSDDRGYAPRRDDRDRGPRRDGDFKPRRDGEFKPRSDDRGHAPRREQADHGPRRDGDFKPRNDDRGYAPRRDDRDRGPRRDGDFKPRRDGEFKPRRDGDFKPRNDDRGHAPRRDDRDRGPRRDGDFKPRNDDRGYAPRRDDDRGHAPRRNDDRGHAPRRDDRDRGPRRDDRGPSKEFGRGGTRGGGRSDRGGAGREFTEAERLQHELRPVRSEHDDPVLPEEIQPKDLNPGARNELKTLQPDVQERVAKHLAMVAYLIDDDPELAHRHALSASRRAGRIPVARETLAITAYRTGDFALALRELRTYRRLSGLDGHLALMVDCERGLGRPEKAIETAQEADVSKLDTEQRVHLAIAVSGARLDLGQTQQALFELEIPELNPKKAFSWSPDLFGAYAAVLEDLGREAEAARWYARADQAAGALRSFEGGFDEVEVFEVHEDMYSVDLEDDAPEAAAPTAPEVAEGNDPEGDSAPDQSRDQDPELQASELQAAEPAPEASAQDTADAVESPEAAVSVESVTEQVEPAAPAEITDASTASVSVEDEVAELLAEAGITDSSDDDPDQAGGAAGEEVTK